MRLSHGFTWLVCIPPHECWRSGQWPEEMGRVNVDAEGVQD